jgi:hypothetical protein
MTSRKTQCERLAVEMSNGGTVTTLSGIEDRILRVPARVYDMKKAGYQVHSRWVVDHGTRLKEYSLTPFSGEDAQLSMFGEVAE